MAQIVDGRLWKNFSIDEICNKSASEDVKFIFTPEAKEHGDMMQELRDYYGKPMIVSSWYRTPSFNKKIGGASNSAHLDGRATDIKGIPESKFRELAIVWNNICVQHGMIGGVGYYKWGMHFDSHSDKFGYKAFSVRDYR